MTARSTHDSKPAVPQDFATVFLRLKPQMTALDAVLRAEIEAFEPEIREMADYCIDTSGKRIRPALVFLSGWNGDGTISQDQVRIAAILEMVHLATLVHDDIMDGAELRRGRTTAARSFGPTASVLLGDALFSHALVMATRFPTNEVCAAVAESMRRVCAGEIVQTMRRGTTNITREDYYRVIDLKTAELFRVCCQLGSRFGGYSAEFVTAASAFGRHLGIGYQIYDDLADFFGDEKRIGKTLGTDLASGKLTLPLLTLMDRLPALEPQALADELCGRREARPADRIRQMTELGVFGSVAAAVTEQIELAEQALRPHRDLPPAALLVRLCDVLREQVRNLRAPGSV